MYTPAQQAAIALVATVPAVEGFRLHPVTCDGMLIGHIGDEYIDELNASAASADLTTFEIGAMEFAVGLMGLAPEVVYVVENCNQTRIYNRGDVVEVAGSPAAGFLSISDANEGVHIEYTMLDALIEALQKLKAQDEALQKLKAEASA